MFVAALCATLPPSLFRSCGLVRFIFAAVRQTFSFSLNPLTAGVWYLLIMIEYSLNSLTAVLLVLCDSRALYISGFNRSISLHSTRPEKYNQ